MTLPAAVRCEVQGKFRMRNIGELLINLVRIAGPKRLSGPAKKACSRLLRSSNEARRHKCCRGKDRR